MILFLLIYVDSVFWAFKAFDACENKRKSRYTYKGCIDRPTEL